MTEFYLTVKDLKEFIKKNKIPDDAHVYYERIEDVYFKKHGWTVLKKEDPLCRDKPDSYIETFCCLYYKDDNNLFITAHY